MKFEYIISIGFFCSVAQELERKGFREFSLPFDWVISDIESIISLIQNQFSELFKEDNEYSDNAKRIDHFIETIIRITPNFRVLLIKHLSILKRLIIWDL